MLSWPSINMIELFLSNARKYRRSGSKGLLLEEPWMASCLKPDKACGLIKALAENRPSLKIQRLSDLTRLIVAHGFKAQAADGDLGGGFLVGSGHRRWLPTVGMPRLPVAAALGIRKFTVRVISVIRREESSTWLLVRSGLFSERAALLLFDRLLEGQPPACASAWIECVEGQDWHVA